MRILVAGASGFLGSELVSFLKKRGHEVFSLTRHESNSNNSLYWDPDLNMMPCNELEGFDAVVNLAGDNIATGRWSEGKKKKILNSRVNSTKALNDCLANLKKPPKVLVNASAIGIYGNRHDEVLSETNPSGSGFLANVCRQWEQAADEAKQSNIRVVKLRFGVVLSPTQGALSKMLIPFKLGLGGKLGPGNQYISWIDIEDALRIILFAIQSPDLQGPINVVAPQPVTNEEFTKAIGKALNRPTFMNVPEPILKLIFGEMANPLFLYSTRAMPQKLLESGYSFLYPTLESSLEKIK